MRTWNLKTWEGSRNEGSYAVFSWGGKCWGGGGCDWGLQRGGKGKCSVSHCLLGHLQRWEMERNWVSFAWRGPSLSVAPGSCDTVVAEDERSPLQQVLHLNCLGSEGKVNGFSRVFHFLEMTSVKPPVSQRCIFWGVYLCSSSHICMWHVGDCICMYVCVYTCH